MGHHPNTPIWESDTSMSDLFAESADVVTDAAESAPITDATQDTTATPDKGFPDGVPVAEMTDAQRAAYYKHQNRHTDRLRKTLSAFDGVTPDDVAAMRKELEALRAGKAPEAEQSATDDGEQADAEADTSTPATLEQAVEQAVEQARAEAEAELIPLIQSAQLKAAAAQVLRDSDQLSAFLAVANPEAFTSDEDGCTIDEDKVMGHLTALFASAGQQPQQYRSWGQYSGGTPPARPGEAGKAEAAKRFGF